MKFERRKEDVKETLGIGLKAKATRISGLHYPDPKNVREDNTALIILGSKLSYKDSMKILESIEKGEIDDWEDNHYVSYFDPTSRAINNTLSIMDFNIELLSIFKESYVEYHGKKYLIP